MTLTTTDEVDEHIRQHRGRGLVLLATLPGCPACVAGNDTWDRLVGQIHGRRAMARAVRDPDPFPPLLFSKALVSGALAWTRKLRSMGVPPVLYFGPDGIEFSGVLADFDSDVARLSQAVHESRSASLGLGFDFRQLLGPTRRLDLRARRRRGLLSV
jgi:hypothetical protein